MVSISMIERVARTLCSLDKYVEDSVFEGMPMWSHYIVRAQVLLAVIREPTRPMIRGAVCHPDLSRHALDWTIPWKAMLDAALAEPR